MDIVEDIVIHDFKFSTILNINHDCQYVDIVSIGVHFIGIEDSCTRLSSAGEMYVLDAYMDELESKITDIVERFQL